MFFINLQALLEILTGDWIRGYLSHSYGQRIGLREKAANDNVIKYLFFEST